MALRMFCDICQAEVTGMRSEVRFFQNAVHIDAAKLDLCKKCYEGIRAEILDKKVKGFKKSKKTA